MNACPTQSDPIAMPLLHRITLKRISSMFKFLTAPVLAASIALTGFSTAPARANNDDVAGFVAGLAALAIIGIAINESQSNQKEKARKKSKKKRQNAIAIRSKKANARLHAKKAHRKIVPAQCLRVLETRNGTRRGFGARCLNRFGKSTAALPQYCKSTIRSRGQVRTLYMARCLKNAGFRMSRI
jgi:hypothetical protein